MSGGFGLPAVDLRQGIAGLGTAYNTAFDAAQKKTTLAKLGEQLQGGDFAGGAKTAFAAGDVETGIGLLKLGETRRQSALAEKASQEFAAGLMGPLGSVEPAPRADASSSSRALPSFADTSGPAGDYVTAMFKRESGGNPNAQASTSSARGLGQFTRDTWNGVARKYPDLALTPVANGQDGRIDPDQMLRATKAFTADNESILQRAGLPVNDATKYSLHIFGAGGGPRFVAGALNDPNKPAAAYVKPEQVAANKRIFYNRDGTPKTAGEVMGDFQRSFSGSGGGSRVAQRSAGSRVAYAGNEAETQALEQRMGMVPPAQTAAYDPRADMPVEGGQVASLTMPGGDPLTSQAGVQRLVQPQIPTSSDADSSMGDQIPTLGGAPGGRVMTMPGASAPMTPDQSSAAHVSIVAENAAGRRPVANDASIGGVPAQQVSQTALGSRLPFLAKALANPNLPEGQRQLASALFKEGLEQARVPDSVKEYMWARANGMTKAQNPGEYAREKAGPTTLAQGSSLVGADGRIITTAPVRENKVTDDIDARETGAARLGLKPGSAAYQSYVLTGKMPREDQQPLTASDKKAILEADDAVVSAETAIGNLKAAKDLSAKAYAGPLASERGWAMSAVGGEAGLATRELDNLVTTNALGQLKAIFGAAPTEGERKILLDIQGSSNLPHILRVKIYDRANQLAERRLEINRDRAADLRNQVYYKPGSGPQGDGSAPSRSASPSRALPAPSPANRPGASSAGDRFGSLVGSGMSKQQAYEQLQREGY